ncbi:MAG: hypothetical protein FWD68_21380 [Alphaproteobacteria bacterium]|nr:hypothetical protein [Alphaproteobacteria bacterium]
MAEVAATVGDRAADEGAAEAAGIAAGNTGRMSPTTFNALLAAVFGGVGGASNNADTPGHALAGGTIGAGMGAALGTGGSKALEAGAPAVSRFASRVVSGKLQAGEPLSPEQLTLIRGAGPPKKGVPPFLPAQFSHSPESVVNDTARLSAKEVNGPRMFNNGKVVPYGFKSAEQYNQAMTELDSAMRASGIEGRIGARGSAVTGVRSPRKPGGGGAFDSGKKISDVDVFIEAKGFLGSKPSEPFTHPDVLQKQYPELGDWSKKWTKQLGRPISVGGWQPGVLPRGGRTSWP